MVTPLDCGRVVSGRYDLVLGGEETGVLRFWDSHVWSAWFGGVVIFGDGEVLRVVGRDGDWLGAEVAVGPIPARVPRFVDEWNDDVLRGVLGGVVGGRALREVGVVEWCTTRGVLRDETGKIVSRLVWDRIGFAGGGGEWFVTLCPLRGYEVVAEDVAGLIEGAGLVDATRGPLGAVWRALGVEPVEFSLKPALTVLASATAREAMTEALVRTFAVARACLPGVIDDADPEFLHDFRVSLRRMRSAIGLIKDAFPAKVARRWKDALGDLARRTNALRDMDVHLHKRRELAGVLPVALRPGLDPFFEHLAAERAAEQKRVAAFFKSAAVRRRLAALEKEMAAEQAASERGAEPIGAEAARRVAKCMKRLKAMCDALTPDSPDERIHEIRIVCKKLRYLLEFFGRFFPAKETELLTRQLGKLQNRLGAFNDTSVQQAYLMAFWENHAASGSQRLAMALGGLVTALHIEHRSLREQVVKALNEFCSGRMLTAVRALRPPSSTP